jgi:hypothetical protein
MQARSLFDRLDAQAHVHAWHALLSSSFFHFLTIFYTLTSLFFFLLFKAFSVPQIKKKTSFDIQ